MSENFLTANNQSHTGDEMCHDYDTSDKYNNFCQRYKASRSPVEVDFRALVSWIRKGDQLTHQIHPYPAKLLPHIIHFFIRAKCLTPSSKIILDPFCGSGTVALEASLAGFTPYIADANPFALLLASTKTSRLEGESLNTSLQHIIKKAKSYKKAPAVDIVNSSIWYSSKNKASLEIILRAINSTCSEKEKGFFLICFSHLAKKLSYADPNISVPVRLKEKEKFTPDINTKIREKIYWINSASAIDEFRKICSANMDRFANTNELFPDRNESVVVGTDARNLKNPTDNALRMDSSSVPLIITSPPYCSAQKYIRASTFSLNWLGLASPKKLSELEGKSIGREHLPKSRECFGREDFLSEKYKTLITSISKVNVDRARITQKYLEEMDDVVNEMVRVLEPDGLAIIVIGNNMVCGHPLHTDDFLIERFLHRGVTLELHLLDDIKSRGLMTKRNKTASLISRESVLIFRK
ncbi:hypothetical protein VA599_16655 [Chromobacterium sp. TRC.1.1.SA]|uniref:site-specific DNA-methyltransferase (cytosine-N(4)-specific) n=1 Tax=Chromobacterium indicum TaxID=3110228 RepID=A0ABV0CMI2_9NEIS